MTIGGIPILPMPEAKRWTFHECTYKITQDEKVVQEGTYWDTGFIEHALKDWVDEYGQEGITYNYEWEYTEVTHQGPPKDYFYMTMHY